MEGSLGTMECGLECIAILPQLFGCSDPIRKKRVEETDTAVLHQRAFHNTVANSRERMGPFVVFTGTTGSPPVDKANGSGKSGGIGGIHQRFQITDNGRGMEHAELAKITDAFYRIDKSRARSLGGAGLGLSLCKEIAALHNGHLQFASKPGKGTQVTVTLYEKEGMTHE